MKRFLSLLTVFLLAFVMAVPAFASDYGGVPNVESVWTDRSTYPYALIYNNNGSYYLITAKNWTERYYHPDSRYQFHLGSMSNANRYVLNGDTWTQNKFNENLGPVGSSMTGGYPVWSSHPIYTDETYTEVWFSSGFCDGSSCPAVDANVDGICDECAMTLRLVNPEIVLPEVTGSNLKTALFKGTFDNINGYLYSTITHTAPYTITAERLNENYRVILSETATVQNFVSSDGKNWSRIYNTKTINFFPAPVEGVELIASDYDWVTGDGEPFFPLPLWAEVEQVTQGEMVTLTSETGGTMKTLVVCGVGLMACLMALNLFGKRWLLFLR